MQVTTVRSIARVAHAERLCDDPAKELVERTLRAVGDRPAEQHEVEVAVDDVTGCGSVGCFFVDGAANFGRTLSQVEERSVRDESRGVGEQLCEREVLSRKPGQPLRDGIIEAPATLLLE